MTEIVINKCYGGFGLSKDGRVRYAEIKGVTLFVEQPEGCLFEHYYTLPPECRTDEDDGYLSDNNIKRDDPALIQTVKELGPRANVFCAELEIVEVPDDVSWCIEEYDGLEWIAENHRTWG